MEAGLANTTTGAAIDHRNERFVDEEDDDIPALSAHALAALKEFLSEQNQPLTEPESPETGGEGKEVALIAEDWRLSQFWYDSETAETIAREIISLSTDLDSRVACIACPTLYAYLKVTSCEQTRTP